ncbi:MAG: hypothetical protein LBU16_09290 [Treponema sp.]|jgi:hypothetical protein|nr:hypothetical protein [Treponema sp.]
MKRFLCALPVLPLMKGILGALLVLPLCPLFSQTLPGAAEPYTIPQTIFVGDQGRLALPLGSAYAGVEAAVIQGPLLPRSKDLTISRVELEKRGEAATLLVDFQGYVPGTIALPPIEIASHTFSGLEVTISSILSVGQQGMVLSGPAEPLAAPGTAALIYGAILGIILLLLALALGSVWGRTRLRDFAERLRRQQVIRVMGRTLKRLRSFSPGRDLEILETLSRDFRVFLGLLTGANCRAMVPSEFLSLDGSGAALRPETVADLFRRCDALRFSGEGLERETVFALLDEFKALAGLLDAAERDRLSRSAETGGAG